MIRTLFRKELRQHWVALVLLAILTLAGYGLIIASRLIAREEGSVLVSLQMFLIVLVPLSGLVLCHRLVVLEYSGRTQLFLEGLPVSRWRMVTAKYILGLVVAAIVSAAIVLAYLLGWTREALTARYIAIVATRALSAAVCAYHFFFAMGFLGRYRVALYLALLFGCFAVVELTDLRLERFGPFALLDDRFPFEAERFPWQALRVTWGLSLGWLGLAFLVALTREGAVASLLAEKMSHREKVFIAALLVGFVFAVSILDEKKSRAPFDLHNAATEQRAGVVTKVAAGTTESDAAARALARQVADSLSATREYLGVSEFPHVFITRRRDLDPRRFERGELEDATGLHVQANFGATEFAQADFIAWLRREVLLAHTDNRARLEPKMWVLDGFTLFPGPPDAATAPLSREKALALRALYGQDRGFAPRDLSHWLSFRERVGEDIAAGVAWSGLRTLARRAGPERSQKFLRSVLSARPPKDIRALLQERSRPLEHLLATEAGLTFEQFWNHWQEELASARRELAGELSQVPKLHGEVTFHRLSPESRVVRYRVRIEPPPQQQQASYSFLHHQLPVFDEEVAPQSIRREQNVFPERREGELPESLARGARLYWTFSVNVPALGCPVISGWKREEIP